MFFSLFAYYWRETETVTTNITASRVTGSTAHALEVTTPTSCRGNPGEEGGNSARWKMNLQSWASVFTTNLPEIMFGWSDGLVEDTIARSPSAVEVERMCSGVEAERQKVCSSTCHTCITLLAPVCHYLPASVTRVVDQSTTQTRWLLESREYIDCWRVCRRNKFRKMLSILGLFEC